MQAPHRPSPVTVLALLAIGATLGAALRYYGALWAVAYWGASFPIGTLLINVLGSFVLGWFLAWANAQHTPHTELRLLIATGFCGSFTTFSTFSYETITLLSTGRYSAAALNIGASFLLGLIAAGAGIGVARTLLG